MRLTTGAHAASLRTSHSATAHIRGRRSSPRLSHGTRRMALLISAAASALAMAHSVMELTTKSLTGDD